ncbi:MAG: ribonuclease BN, partial [Halobacteriota archaeon]
LSISLKKVIALQITHLIIKNFMQMDQPLTADEIAAKLVIPIAFIQPVLSNLVACHIIVEFKNQDEDDEVYQPAVDINILTIAYVINALEQCGQNHLPHINQEQLYMDAVNNFRKLMEASEQNRLLKDIAIGDNLS